MVKDPQRLTFGYYKLVKGTASQIAKAVEW